MRDVLATYFNEFEKKKITPLIDIPNAPVIIWADEDALFRIFSNIIYNAVIHGDGEYKIRCTIVSSHCKITISNHTTTICQEDVPHLFDRFYITDQSRTKKTTGLGLSIAQKLTTQMGGKIAAGLQNQIFEIHIIFTIQSS